MVRTSTIEYLDPTKNINNSKEGQYLERNKDKASFLKYINDISY